MVGFYFEARRAQLSPLVEFVVYNGSREGTKHQLGLLAFTPDEWQAFRTVIIGGMRAASFLRIPIEFMDQTRQKPDLKSVM